MADCASKSSSVTKRRMLATLRTSNSNIIIKRGRKPKPSDDREFQSFRRQITYF